MRSEHNVCRVAESLHIICKTFVSKRAGGTSELQYYENFARRVFCPIIKLYIADILTEAICNLIQGFVRFRHLD